MLFNVKLANPEPPGEISTSGELGPWNTRSVGQTPVAGEYVFQRADLGVFKGIREQLSSRGKFQGILEQIGVQGETDTPDFQVRSSMHAVDLRTRFERWLTGRLGTRNCSRWSRVSGILRCDLRAAWREDQARTVKKL